MARSPKPAAPTPTAIEMPHLDVRILHIRASAADLHLLKRLREHGVIHGWDATAAALRAIIRGEAGRAA